MMMQDFTDDSPIRNKLDYYSDVSVMALIQRTGLIR